VEDHLAIKDAQALYEAETAAVSLDEKVTSNLKNKFKNC
jgi:hypothetical protein